MKYNMKYEIYTNKFQMCDSAWKGKKDYLSSGG